MPKGRVHSKKKSLEISKQGGVRTNFLVCQILPKHSHYVGVNLAVEVGGGGLQLGEPTGGTTHLDSETVLDTGGEPDFEYISYE